MFRLTIRSDKNICNDLLPVDSSDIDSVWTVYPRAVVLGKLPEFLPLLVESADLKPQETDKSKTTHSFWIFR